jgi:hypothetical protein
VKADGTIGYFPTEYAERITNESSASTTTTTVTNTEPKEEEEEAKVEQTIIPEEKAPYVPKFSEKEAVAKMLTYYRCYKFRKNASSKYNCITTITLIQYRIFKVSERSYESGEGIDSI